jgi:predicted secreted protein
MPTAAIPGYNAVLLVSDDAGANYFAIAELKNVELTITADIIDATSHASGGWKDGIQGLKSWSCTAEALAIFADTAQTKVHDALVNGTRMKAKFQPKALTGLPQWLGDVFVKTFKVAGPNADAVAENLELEGVGSLVKSAQP